MKSPEGASPPHTPRVRQSASDLLELSSLAAAVKRNARRILIPAFIGLALGLALVKVTPTTYQATAVVLAAATPGVLVPDIDIDADSAQAAKQPKTRTPDTEAQLIRSSVVLDNAARRLKGEVSRSELTRRIRLSAPPNTRVLNVAFTESTPELAQRGAEAVAIEFTAARKAYLEARAKRLTGALLDQREILRKRVSAMTGNTLESQTRRGDLDDQIQAIDRGLAEIAASAGARTEVVRHASLPKGATHGNSEVPPVSGFLGGALLGLAAGYLRDHRRPRVRGADQVREATGLPVFARLGTRERTRGLATEVRLVSAHRVLVTGVVPEPLTNAVGTLLRTALGYVDEPGEVVVAGPAVTAQAMRQARNVDLVVLVAELGRSYLSELTEAAHAISRTGTPAAIVLAPSSRVWRRRR